MVRPPCRGSSVAEQLIRNQQVVSSILTPGTIQHLDRSRDLDLTPRSRSDLLQTVQSFFAGSLSLTCLVARLSLAIASRARRRLAVYLRTICIVWCPTR